MPSAADPTISPSLTTPAPNPWTASMPWVFVLLWSTGFIVAKFSSPYSPPLTFLLLRFTGVSCLLLPLVLVVRAPWPHGQIRHVAVAGVLLQAGYLGGVWTSMKIGMPAGISALIVGMQPVITAFAAPLIGESLRPRQWLGLLIGLCGVALVVAHKMHLAGLSFESVGLCTMALASITIGTLYQKRYCARFDLRTGALIQFAASFVTLLPFAVMFEHLDWTLSSVDWTPRFVAALIWSILALSIGAIFLLFALIRKDAATKVTSLMYLTPPTTALMAWLMFGETLGMAGLLGMLLAVVGVAFVVTRA